MAQHPTHKSKPAASWFLRFLSWREKHVSERAFVIFLALIVGILSGFAAMLLRFLIHRIASALTADIDTQSGNWLYILLPAVGVVITYLYAVSYTHLTLPTILRV